MRISCSRVAVVYTANGRSTEALADVSLEIREGEFIALVGPSGCGKTSLLRTLAGLVQPRAGEVVRAGDVGDGTIGLVLQEDSLFPWMTALENAAFALEMRGVSRVERHTLALPVLERFGLAGHEQAYPHQLSAGMKQRVAVARAFLSKAGLLLMDEPFGALDAMTRQTLQQELLDEWTAHRRTVLFVTHDVDEAVLLSSRVLVMTRRAGSISAEFDVPFGYPRDYAITLTDEFVALKREIYSLLGVKSPSLARSRR
jgi:ABC-type nitrate/sulfonate/bicarbonate transport system ATPase subunit